MNETLKNNLYIIQDLNNYPNIKPYMSFKEDKLFFNVDGKVIEIDLTQVNLREIYNDNLRNNLSNMSINDFNKILEIHTKKDVVLPPINIEEEQKDNPKIKNFKIIKKVREDGSVLEYPYYIDDNNQIHVLFNYAGTNILNEYQKLFIALGGNVTARDLYEVLERKMKNVELQADYTFNDDEVREGTKLESDLVNKQDESKRVYYNAEHGVYNLGNNLYTFNVQNNGLNKNTIDTDEKEETASYNDNFDENSLYIEPNNDKEAPIISEEEYYMLIKYTDVNEKPEIGLFESFIEDVIRYEDYISSDLLALLNRYKNYMVSLEVSQNMTEYEQKALDRFKTILDKQEQIESELNKENTLIKVRKLEEQYDKAGYSLIYFIFGGTVLILLLTVIMLINS